MKKLTDAERKFRAEARERIAGAFHKAVAEGIREAHKEKMAKKAKPLTRLEIMNGLKQTLEHHRDRVANYRATIMRDASSKKLENRATLRKQMKAIEGAMDIIRDMNQDDVGPERFCPRCESRLADEGVCMRCDSDLAEATPCHKSAD